MDKENVTPIEEQTEVPAEKTELEVLKEEKDELYDNYLRTLAEYDNFRKRSQREKDAIYGDATTEAVKKLLPVLDSFERALNYECRTRNSKRESLLSRTPLKKFSTAWASKKSPTLANSLTPTFTKPLCTPKIPLTAKT